MNGLPINRYQVRQIIYYTRLVIALVAGIILIGNIATTFFIKRILIDPAHYTVKEGFILFTSAEGYFSLIENYPYDPGTRLTVHTMRRGETYWDVSSKYNVTLDTIIGANPHLSTLKAREGTKIVIPSENGLLMVIDSVWDVIKMKRLLHFTGPVQGKYRHSVFRLLSQDDVRIAFLRGAHPHFVNSSLQPLYDIRKTFQNPIKNVGHYTSLYGDRIDPMYNETGFHNGVDICARMGTPIYPVRDGLVLSTGWHSGYGLTVTLVHREGYTSLYGHCSAIMVNAGDWVEKNTKIGKVGSTGRSTGPHLHFMMMRHGKMLNPLFFIW